ncbi:TRAF family member-associated NF-kappa-B activator [Chanos chanos]|uniref:TRAF family member-associated NF-kappa-B activator n=1 Tax=Chanos chanos TaxID=29144 RepID=A0A6J2WDU4_CHACN|nr:TRAF family member-associated NF-kappa-B activator [Chanos chanos]
MDRSNSDQLNKAFEAYRKASIEKETAQKELKEATEHFRRHTQQLMRTIQSQEQQILDLKEQLRSANTHASGEAKCCETVHRKQEMETMSPSNHRPDNLSSSHRTNHFLETLDCAAISPLALPGASSIKNEDVLQAFKDMQGQFEVIQILARRQKDHLKRLYKENNAGNEPAISMPIQCTEETAELAEGPFPSPSSRSEGDNTLTPSSLASRGASQEDGDLENSLSKLSVKFPPPADSEYEFLHSAPEKQIDLALPRKVLGGGISTVMEEPSLELSPMAFPFPVSPPPLPMSSASVVHENVRGPEQTLWSPELCDLPESIAGAESQQNQSSNNCAFCTAVVPHEDMYSHLNSHFQNKASD